MKSQPPFIGQESSDTCAIACLRMILAHRSKEVKEAELVKAAGMEPGGLNPEELARICRVCELGAMEKQLDQEGLFDLIQREQFPIVFLHRRPLDRIEAAHAVIPISFSRHYVHFLDPLRGKRRTTIRKFEQARRLVGQWVVVWEY
jgi:ABC-type bacteriocin/lantibiotic exporter with double-glycine peptidase domain